jgi:hypothetical protein
MSMMWTSNHVCRAIRYACQLFKIKQIKLKVNQLFLEYYKKKQVTGLSIFIFMHFHAEGIIQFNIYYFLSSIQNINVLYKLIW